MRTQFFQALEPIFVEDTNIIVITADLGYKLFDYFKEKDSRRFYNVGVAEANMIGVAAGLSLCGKKVYCYSICPFLVMRTFEQVRIDIDYHNLDVKLVAVGGGLAYGLEGITHHGIEDIALMRTLPNMTIVVPADPLEAAKFAKLSYKHIGPMYIRLCHTKEPTIHKDEPEIEIGKADILVNGNDIVIIATGRMVHTVMQAETVLRRRGISTTVVNMHTIKPLDENLIKSLSTEYKAIFTVEEHGLVGGLGSAVAEVLAETGYRGVFRRFGIDRTRRYVGNAEWLRKKYGLTPEDIAKRILTSVKEGA